MFIFWEFGGRVVQAPAAAICEANNNELFAARMTDGSDQPVSMTQACDMAASHDIVLLGFEGPRSFGFFGKRGQARWVAREHCREGKPAFVYTGVGAPDQVDAMPWAQVCADPGAHTTLGVRQRGFKVIPADLADIIDEIRQIDLKRFAMWLLIATLVKSIGIFGNALRWRLLLLGQEIRLTYRYLLGSYFVGRWFGIITPGTLGLDGYRLYDSIRATGKPVECTAVIFIDKVIGLVSLLGVAALVFPLGRDLLPLDPAAATKVLGGMIVAATGFFVLLLIPGISSPFVRFIPNHLPFLVRPKLIRIVWGFIERAHTSVTAYANHRGYLISAVLLAAVGHFTTALMYWALLMGITDAPPVGMILLSALIMTSATLVGPSIGGEGIREFVFVQLLKDFVMPAQAFLFGHIGFWIEKLVLSVPGGLIYLLRPSVYQKNVTAADLAALEGRHSLDDPGDTGRLVSPPKKK